MGEKKGKEKNKGKIEGKKGGGGGGGGRRKNMVGLNTSFVDPLF